MRIPLVIVFNIIAFNLTMLAWSMQVDYPAAWHASPTTKAIAWVAAIAAWGLSYKYRKKTLDLF
jgi:hypothetical protein